MILRDQVITALDVVLASGAVEKTIATAVEKTVTSIVSEALREYSDFGKAVREKVTASLKIDEDLGLPAYGEMVLKVVRQIVDTQMQTAINAQVKTQMETLLQNPPETIKLTELVRQFAEDNGEWGDDEDDREHDDFSLMIRDSYGFKYIELDSKPNKKQHGHEICIGVSGDGKMFSLRLNGVATEKTLFACPIGSFERSLFYMQVAGTKIEFDASETDIPTDYESYRPEN